MDAGGKLRTIIFGDVTITCSEPGTEPIEANVAAGSLALARVAKRLAKPGVQIHRRANVPLYYIDPARPDLLVRELNGEIEYGILTDGEFKVVS